MMDTPESPQQSPQSPEEEQALSDSELLGSVDGEADQAISDSEIVEEENDNIKEAAEVNQKPDSRLIEDGQEEDEVVPDFVSDPEEDEPIRDSEQEDKSIILTEDGDEASGTQKENEKAIHTPLSPDSEHGRNCEVNEDKTYSEEEEDDDDKGKVDEEESKSRRASLAVREIKDEAASVSRELDEHELDYDEEVPEEPSVPPEEEEEEDEVKAEAEAEAESCKRKEKKPILPPSPTDDVSKKSDEGKGRSRRDSFRDKRNEDDDGEIDEGEIDDDDLEEGEVKDPSDRKIRPRPICRFFMKGNCTWGMNCRFIHPGVNDKGNYSLITKPDPFSPNGAPPGGPHPLMPNNPWAAPAVEELPPPPPPEEPPVESAWERGLRHAKEVLKKATMRKEQEPDFEEKRFNVTIGEDEREFDKENEFFRERSYRIIRDEMEFRDPVYGDPYADPYYDYEMDALWRGGQYENFRVQYTEAPLPYHFADRERERDPRERHRDRERERDHRERERRQRERERERERLRRKEEWERDRMKRDDKERPRLRQPREPRDKKDEEKLKGRPPLDAPPNRPIETPLKKESGPAMRRPDEWKDPWRRSKSPRRRPNMGSPLRGRRRHRPSGSSVSLSNSSRSSSRSSSYTGSGSSRSRSSSFSSYSSHSSAHSSFSGSRSRSRSFSSSPSRSPAAQKNSKNRPEPPPGPKGVPLKPGAVPPPRRDKPPVKKAPSPPLAGPQGRPAKPSTEPPKPPAKPPPAPRDTSAPSVSAAVPAAGRPAPPKESAKPPTPREGRRKERHVPRRRTVSGSVSGSGSSYSGSSSRSRYSSNSLSRSRSGSRKSRSLSVSSVSSVSSASSSSSSVRSADSDDMYADLASPVSSASSHSPSPGRTRKDRGAARDRAPQNRDKAKERPTKKEEVFREERRKMDQVGGPPPRGPVPRSGPGSRGPHPSPANTAPPTGYGGSGSHKDIKLTLLNKQADKGNRKRYLPSDKDRPGSPVSKRMALSPDRGRDKRIPGRAPPSPRTERPKAQAARPPVTQGDRKRPLSPPPKSSGKAQAAPSGKSVAPGSSAGAGSNKPSNTLSRREELLKQLKAVEDAIARKRAKMPAK